MRVRVAISRHVKNITENAIHSIVQLCCFLHAAAATTTATTTTKSNSIELSPYCEAASAITQELPSILWIHWHPKTGFLDSIISM
jgi:hypothetical protein